MKALKAAVSVLVVLSLVGLVACGGGGGDGSAIVGKWEGDMEGMAGVFEFTSDNKLIMTVEAVGASLEGTYRVDGDKLIMSLMGEDNEATYKIDGNTLTITDEDDESVTLTRKQ